MSLLTPMLTYYFDMVYGPFRGDEGKGIVTHRLAATGKYHFVVRFQGGPNAGHTLKVGDCTFISHNIPSGILCEGVMNFIGAGCVVDPVKLLNNECAELIELGIPVFDRLRIAERATLIFPTHVELDWASEAYLEKTKNSEVGSTKCGITPAYKDKTGRKGFYFFDILNDNWKEKAQEIIDWHKKELSLYCEYYTVSKDLDQKVEEFFAAIEELRSKAGLITSTKEFLLGFDKSKKGLIEGAQGAGLGLLWGDIKNGMNVTSSHTGPAAACLQLGIPRDRIVDVYAVVKPYTTTVGNVSESYIKPFTDSRIPRLLQEAGCEKGATTGRSRHVVMLDLKELMSVHFRDSITKLVIVKCDIVSVLLERGIKELPFVDTEGLETSVEVWENPADAELNGAVPHGLVSFFNKLDLLISPITVDGFGYGPEEKDYYSLYNGG